MINHFKYQYSMIDYLILYYKNTTMSLHLRSKRNLTLVHEFFMFRTVKGKCSLACISRLLILAHPR